MLVNEPNIDGKQYMQLDNITWLPVSSTVQDGGSCSDQQVLDFQQTGSHEVHLNCVGTIKRPVANFRSSKLWSTHLLIKHCKLYSTQDEDFDYTACLLYTAYLNPE